MNKTLTLMTRSQLKLITLEQLLEMSLDEKIQAYKQGYVLQGKDEEIAPIPADQLPAKYGFMNHDQKTNEKIKK